MTDGREVIFASSMVFAFGIVVALLISHAQKIRKGNRAVMHKVVVGLCALIMIELIIVFGVLCGVVEL